MVQDEAMNLAGQIATAAPVSRQAERAPIEMDAGLRQRGAGGVSIHIHDLSTHGFRATTHLELEPGTEIWLRLPGLESWHGKVAWIDGHLIGCQFARPLHPAVLDMILRSRN